MVLCFALPPSCVLVESIIASVYAIPASRDRIRALGLAIRLSCTIIEHGEPRTVAVFPKSHRKFLRTVFSNRKFLSVVLHSINDFPLLALLTMFKSSKTKKKWCRATKKGRRKSKWVLAQMRSSYERECHKTDCKKIVLADKNTIDRKSIKGDGGQ
jgi:hypothetical protein